MLRVNLGPKIGLIGIAMDGVLSIQGFPIGAGGSCGIDLFHHVAAWFEVHQHIILETEMVAGESAAVIDPTEHSAVHREQRPSNPETAPHAFNSGRDIDR